MNDARAAQIQALAAPILADRGMELVEFTCHPHGGQLHVRLLVDRVGGVTIQQCAHVNQLLGQALEAANLFDGSYTIEVSSPGLDRPLVSKRDFERALGEDVRIEVVREEGKAQELHGMLLAVQHEAIVLKTASGNVTLPFAQIRAAKKALRWNRE
ncbi:MAG: ribosome maturation factor RimP [Candidatus Omnitrophica bacterium]|nr:ribosome maturation factor RimP [Candidatus Omnitrophota bacterium]